MNIKKEEIGYSMVLVGAMIIVLLFVLSNDVSEITGYFSANDKFSNSIMIDKLDVSYNNVNLIYSINESNFDENQIKVDIWILNGDNFEIRRVKDIFLKSEDANKEVLIDLNAEASGVYILYIAPSNNLDNYIKKDFILGKSSTTGHSILGNPRDKMIAYGVFLIIIGIGIIFIVIAGWRKRDKKIRGKRK